MQSFSERISDCEIQNWTANIKATTKLEHYAIFKSTLTDESYLHLNVSWKLRRSLAKFRVGCHMLQIEKGRHYGIKRDERFCTLCLKRNVSLLEDEFHTLFICESYSDIRNLYIPYELSNQKTLSAYYLLMKSTDSVVMYNLAVFISKMFVIRERLMNVN